MTAKARPTSFSQVITLAGGKKAVAEALGCSVEWVRQMEVGNGAPERMPSLDLMIRIEELFGLPFSYWISLRKSDAFEEEKEDVSTSKKAS